MTHTASSPSADLAPLATHIHRQWQAHGRESPIPGLFLTCAEAPSGPIHAVYRPSLCVVVQGAKTSQLGERLYQYEAGKCLIDPLMRLMALYDQPRDRPVLSPLIRREIVWRLLNSPLGRNLRQIGFADTRLSRIGRTIAPFLYDRMMSVELKSRKLGGRWIILKNDLMEYLNSSPRGSA